MSYQRGALRRVRRKQGGIWVLRYRTNAADGRRVENTLAVGLVRDLPSEKAAWGEVNKLGLLTRINEPPATGRIHFAELAAFYLRADFGADAVRPKSEGTTLNMQHIVNDYLVPQFGPQVADDIKPLDIQRWLKSLHLANGLAWPTVSKIRGVMLRAYKTGLLHERVTRNPVAAVETRSKTHYRAIMLTLDDYLRMLITIILTP